MIETGEGDLTIKEWPFWDLFFMKLLRNIASVKYQWMVLLYIPVIYGMFHINEKTGAPWISDSVGLSALFGGFVTLALGRIIANTSLVEKNDPEDCGSAVTMRNISNVNSMYSFDTDK